MLTRAHAADQMPPTAALWFLVLSAVAFSPWRLTSAPVARTVLLHRAARAPGPPVRGPGGSPQARPPKRVTGLRPARLSPSSQVAEPQVSGPGRRSRSCATARGAALDAPAASRTIKSWARPTAALWLHDQCRADHRHDAAGRCGRAGPASLAPAPARRRLV